MTSATTKDIIAIGGSTGSGAVLRQILAELPPGLPAAILIATHVPSHGGGHFLAEMLSSNSRLPVHQSVDGQPVERGHVYIAPPDRHLLLLGGTIRHGLGPRENMARPAIDPLFRSVALSVGERAVGVVLTGLLNDGASGLFAIKSMGGTSVVQHPLDAEAEEMPLAALEAVDVDHVAAAAGLANLLRTIVLEPAGPMRMPPDTLRLEVEIAMGARLGSRHLREFAEPSALSCPDCSGVLSEVKVGGPLRYRCQIGHAYTGEVLAARTDEVDEAIRVAMRIMEERVTLVERMGRDAADSGRRAAAELYESRAEEYRRYADALRQAAVASITVGGEPHRGD